MAVIDKDKIIETIQAITSDVESYVDDFLGIYQFIRRSIAEQGDRIEKLSSVDLIAIEDLYQDYEKLEHHNLVLQKKEREIVNIFIFGDFQEDYQITWELSEVLAYFYVEYLILPIINNVSYQEFQARPTIFTEQLKHGVRLYEAKRSLHRNSAAVSR
ncbi:MAG: hypothetical protein GDA38_27645 [Hormoscilla sp. SP12CHS1]|nr:hypothetical protein [Hormoscilla sp. SP12CHS1]